jgi:dienelactone hydrolase
VALAALSLAGPAHAAENPGTPGGLVDPVTEAQNFSKVEERQAVYDTPTYQAELATIGAENAAAAAQMQATDPARLFAGNVCATGQNGCAGDIRLYDWASNGYGIVEPVLYTARDGATISGHVWATKAGPAKRPGIVITAGSVQSDEQVYWMFAQALAKDGYVVLTTDPQGQGQSDIPGEAPDQTEGVPAQTDGRPFYDGTEDALNFLLSTPSNTYEPVPSCNTGTSHAAKQNSRVAAGLDAAYDPFWSMLDPTRIGIAGHSYGASGVSYVGQLDPRVKAIVAWDNLITPAPQGSCVDASQRAIPAITKPALGLSADYGLPPTPNETVPQPLGKSAGSLAYTSAGVDTGEIVIRGGSHFEFSFIPNQGFGASLRGVDMATWYSLAWFDKYVKGDPTADARLLTTRWQSDAPSAAIDPNGDGNDFSFYYRSRLDIHLADGGTFDCEDLRTGCAGMSAADGVTGSFSYLSYDTTPDVAPADALPESPWPVALPVLAVAVIAGALWRRRRRTSPTR